MPELRWSLLALGVLFIVGLVLWERRKRGAPANRSTDAPIDASADSSADQQSELPAVSQRVDRGERVEREPLRKPKLVEIVDPSVEGLDDVEPGLGTLPRISDAAAPAMGQIDASRISTDDAAERAARWLAETQPSLGDTPLQGLGSTAVSRPALKVDWPADNARRIVAVRVVPRAGEKFTGGAVRQALLGEGFELGDFDIFHLPLDDGRVVVSAANLTKPGTFRLATMDAEMFSGLNVFAVLPGIHGPDGLAMDEAGNLSAAHARPGIVWLFSTNRRGLPSMTICPPSGW